jgi:hypothetical protein
MPAAKLSIDLEARLAKLQEGLDKAGRLSETFATRVEARWANLRTGAASIGTALAAAFGGAALTAMVRNTLNGVDALNDLRDATGASIENLSALEQVAMRNGESLDLVSGILLKFNDALKEARPDNDIGRALNAIGVSATALRQQDPAEALRQLAVALTRFEDDGNKARIVQELFGKSIRDAAPFLNDLAEQTALVGTVTGKQSKETELLNKQLAQLRTAATDAGRALVAELVPGVSRLITQFTEAKTAGEAFAKVWQTFLKNTGLDAISRQEKEIEKLNRTIAVTQWQLDQMTEVARRNPGDQAYAGAVKRLREELAALQSQSVDATAALKLLADVESPRDPGFRGGGIGATQNPAAQTVKAQLPDIADQEKLKKAARAFEDYQASVTQSLAKLIEDSDVVRMAKLNDQLKRLQELADAGLDPAIITEVRRALLGQDTVAGDDTVLAKRIDQQRQLNELIAATPLAQQEQLVKQQQLLDEAYRSSTISSEKYAQATQQIREQMVALDPRLRAVEEQTRRMGDQLEATLGESLQAALQGNFDGIADAWANMLSRMALEAATQNLANALFGGGGAASFLGALFGGAAGAPAAGPTWLGGPQAANGAVVTAATPFLTGNRVGVMGEAGPEAVMPLRRGRDGKLGVAGGGGSGGMVNNINIAAGVQRSEMMAALEMAMNAMEARFTMRLRSAGVA